MISFPCTNCNSIIEVRYLFPGEQAICKKCNAKNIVPIPERSVDVEGKNQNDLSLGNYNFTDEFTKRNIRSTDNITNTDDTFLKVLLYFSIGLLFHVFEFRIGNGNINLNFSIIGAVFTLRASYLLYKLGGYKKILKVLIIICSLDTLSYISELLGFREYFFFNLRIVEVLILLRIYYKFTINLEVFREYKRYIFFIFITFVLEVGLFIAALISTPFLIFLNKLFSGFDFYLWMFGIFGVVLPITLLHFLVLILFAYISFSMYKAFKNRYI